MSSPLSGSSGQSPEYLNALNEQKRTNVEFSVHTEGGVRRLVSQPLSSEVSQCFQKLLNEEGMNASITNPTDGTFSVSFDLDANNKTKLPSKKINQLYQQAIGHTPNPDREREQNLIISEHLRSQFKNAPGLTGTTWNTPDQSSNKP